MPTAPSRFRLRWQALVVAALTATLVWLFLRSVPLDQLGRALLRAHPWLVVAAVVVTFQTYLIRARRWQSLLAPIGPTAFRTAFRTTVIGFAVSFLVPRAGEVVRPYLLARQEKLPASATFATIIVERLLDLVTVLLLFAASLLVIDIDVGPEVRTSGLLAAVSAVVALVVLFVSAGHPERLAGWTARLVRWLPGRVGGALSGLVRTFAEGLAVMRQPAHLARAMVWSIPLWLSLALGIWLTSLAFDLTFSFPATFLIMLILVVGVAVPTPGNVGAFHLAYFWAVTRFFSFDEEAVAAAGIVLHGISFLPVTFVGLLLMWQDGLTPGRLRGLEAEARRAGGKA
ncbi:MAG TPA: lysylphosphatidylglycerol synthase transmembrane domain-containing protein [Vicinamibacterales bacterium]|nr:lysylphosphatidylglycerol synthase transmembrane domain-containing protein [Vicinamibacterales bacterium]